MTNNEIIKAIATLTARQDALEHRMDKVENLVVAIHENTTAVSNLSVKFDKFSKIVENNINNTNEQVKRQDEQMAEGFKRQNEQMTEGFTRHGERIGELEKKGSKKLEYIIGAIITAGVAALFMYFVGGGTL